MKETVSKGDLATPMLFPLTPGEFWLTMRQIIREEMANIQKAKPVHPGYETSGMTYKPLYKIAEVCSLFQVSKPTIYDWVWHGKLKPYKIRSRVYFLWRDIQELINPASGEK